MERRKDSTFGAGPDAAGPELEGRLRNLILSNTSREGTFHQGYSIPERGDISKLPLVSSTLATSQRGSADIALQAQHHAPKPSRKRPNQAQRRQMSSELSIQIDPRYREPLTEPNRWSRPSFTDRQRAFCPTQRGHQYSHTIPGREQPPHGSWRTSSHQSSFDLEAHRDRLTGRNSAYHQSSASSPSVPGRGGSRQLFNHRRDPPPESCSEAVICQAEMLNQLCCDVERNSEIERADIALKEAFRLRIERISRQAIAQYENEHAPGRDFPATSVQLQCFGSLSSGFATKASDMDLGLLSPLSSIQPDAPASPIPRLLEKALLAAGFGARLLTRTRVPIIKLCEAPPEELRQNLLLERQKWEDGVKTDAGDGDDDGEPAQDTVAHSHQREGPCSASYETGPSSNTQSGDVYFDGDHLQLRNLKQRRDSSLSAYYALAKRTLRRAGGRDVTISNYRDFSSQEWLLLNEVCQAFVGGLWDADLRLKLAQYPSLSFESFDGMPPNRSLYGVLLQVEGQEILRTWRFESEREIFPLSQSLRQQAENSVRIWTNIQHKRNFGLDPVAYNKELQLALEQIKKLPTMQLLKMEQAQHETPSQYHIRARQIVDSLHPPHSDFSNAAKQLIAEKYTAGIFQPEVRDQVQIALADNPQLAVLEAIAQRHKSLHLAWELEKAVEAGAYEESRVDDIKAYMTLLRGPLQKSFSGNPVAPEFVVPIPPDMSDLLDRIQLIRDPHNMAPNQPRDRYQDKLEFPETGAGVQCDINFSAHLALQNTLLLRCYSRTDPRVRPMVIFVKHWAKVRGINSGYRGTLSSYGYVLMVLHYLVNIVQPFVCPNLQQLAPAPPLNPSPIEVENTICCRGYNIQFWRNEPEIVTLAQQNRLNHNTQTIGDLLRGFFEYYAHGGLMSSGSGRGFDWGRDVLSLRTHGGLLSKQSKGWTGAKTVIEGGFAQSSAQRPSPQTQTAELNAKSTPQATKGKEVRHRYLFAIEDPFELDHNVARTVTHNGIVSIRDEFRRAWKIIRAAGNETGGEGLLQSPSDNVDTNGPFLQLLADIHGMRGGFTS